MNNIVDKINLENNISFTFILMFMAALYPISIKFGNDGISANYIFILIPIVFSLINGGKFYLPSNIFNVAILVYIIIFYIAAIYQIKNLDYIERRFISFVIFMSIFSFIFTKIDRRMIISFKIAIIAMSFIFSIKSIETYISMGAADLGFYAKNIVGSQRYGFIYIISIWLLIFQKVTGFTCNLMKFICITIILIGLLLTFSRSGIVALLGSACFFILINFSNIINYLKIRINNLLIFLLILIAISFFIFEYFYLTLDFYLNTLFSLKTSSGENIYDLEDLESSGGYRIYIFWKILDYVFGNPFTGSGFLGVWIMFEDGSGSSHNQFTDVLFRTGIFGFIIYCIILFRLLCFLNERSPGLFWGMIGVIIYGCFHETFKESQGAFILAFLLGMLSSRIRENGINQKLFKESKFVGGN